MKLAANFYFRVQVFRHAQPGMSFTPRSLCKCLSGSPLRNYSNKVVFPKSAITKWNRTVLEAVPLKKLEITPVKVRAKVRALFVIVSKDRFMVKVQFDPSIIKIFNKMDTKHFDSTTSTWSFGLKDYYNLSHCLQKDCSYLRLILVPKPIIERLLSKLASNDGGAAAADMDWNKIDSKLLSTLMPFQKKGIEFCVQRGGCAMIADDMGLGKTLQAIAVMRYYCEDWPLLVVCPSSVKYVWANAFKHWLPSLHHDEVHVINTAKESLSDCAVNIISYNLAQMMPVQVKKMKFKAVIADESHFLKNHKTARYRALSQTLKEAKRLILLTGTPALSRPIELFTQFCAMEKDKWLILPFAIRYCNAFKGCFGWCYKGASNLTELHVYMEESFMIRRMKHDVLDQLPSKSRQMVLLDTSDKSKELESMSDKLKDLNELKGANRRDSMITVFEKTGIFKVPAVIGYILDLLESRTKMIVFGHHNFVLNSICASLRTKKYKFIRIDGTTPSKLRQVLCDQFQQDEDCLVAVMSITAGGSGLTLTAASTVIFAELFWNPGTLVQAEDRVHRIGQSNSVNVHYLVSRSTLDDFMWPLLQTKLNVLNQAGLAMDDFSKAGSMAVKNDADSNYFDCFEEEEAYTDSEWQGEQHEQIRN